MQIRGKQEQLLKVRNFLPPQAQEPEIFLLEKLVASASEADAKLSAAEEAETNGGKLLLTGGGCCKAIKELGGKKKLAAGSPY